MNFAKKKKKLIFINKSFAFFALPSLQIDKIASDATFQLDNSNIKLLARNISRDFNSTQLFISFFFSSCYLLSIDLY